MRSISHCFMAEKIAWQNSEETEEKTGLRRDRNWVHGGITCPSIKWLTVQLSETAS